MTSCTDAYAVAYLARGKDDDALSAFERFLQTYRDKPAGLPHKLYIIYKGFTSSAALESARHCFERVTHEEIFTDDLGFDIGAYGVSLQYMTCTHICFLNTWSELVSVNWLAKMVRNLALPGVGLVGASGSFESHDNLDPRVPSFPNIHVRTNAFMLRLELAKSVFASLDVSSKLEAYLSESGEASITKQMESRGLTYLLVGSDGRGYSPRWWPTSGIFRQGNQSNLLIHDNETRRFSALPWGEKRLAYLAAWGELSSSALIL